MRHATAARGMKQRLGVGMLAVLTAGTATGCSSAAGPPTASTAISPTLEASPSPTPTVTIGQSVSAAVLTTDLTAAMSAAGPVEVGLGAGSELTCSADYSTQPASASCVGGDKRGFEIRRVGEVMYASVGEGAQAQQFAELREDADDPAMLTLTLSTVLMLLPLDAVAALAGEAGRLEVTEVTDAHVVYEGDIDDIATRIELGLDDLPETVIMGDTATLTFSNWGSADAPLAPEQSDIVELPAMTEAERQRFADGLSAGLESASS